MNYSHLFTLKKSTVDDMFHSLWQCVQQPMKKVTECWSSSCKTSDAKVRSEGGENFHNYVKKSENDIQ